MTGEENLPTPADAESIARENWGLRCQAEPLAGEVDRNFLLVTPSQGRGRERCVHVWSGGRRPTVRTVFGAYAPCEHPR